MFKYFSKDQKFHRVATITECSNITALNNTVIYVEESKTFYEYKANDATLVNDENCLQASPNHAKWIAITGQFSKYSQNSVIVTESDFVAGYYNIPSFNGEIYLFVVDAYDTKNIRLPAFNNSLAGKNITLAYASHVDGNVEFNIRASNDDVIAELFVGESILLGTEGTNNIGNILPLKKYSIGKFTYYGNVLCNILQSTVQKIPAITLNDESLELTPTHLNGLYHIDNVNAKGFKLPEFNTNSAKYCFIKISDNASEVTLTPPNTYSINGGFSNIILTNKNDFVEVTFGSSLTYVITNTNISNYNLGVSWVSTEW